MDANFLQHLYSVFNPEKATIADLERVRGLRLACRDWYSDIQVLEFRIQEALKLGISLEMYVQLLKEREVASVAAFGTNE